MTTDQGKRFLHHRLFTHYKDTSLILPQKYRLTLSFLEAKARHFDAFRDGMAEVLELCTPKGKEKLVRKMEQHERFRGYIPTLLEILVAMAQEDYITLKLDERELDEIEYLAQLPIY